MVKIVVMIVLTEIIMAVHSGCDDNVVGSASGFHSSYIDDS